MASKALTIAINGNAQGFAAAAKGAADALTNMKDNAGGAGDKLSGLGASLSSFGEVAAVGVAAAGVAVVGLGVAAFKLGDDFSQSYDKIRIGTGATGEKLEGLKEDFKQVLRDVPTDFEGASSAVSQLNQTLGLTGPELESRSEQLINLSRITKTDLNTNIKDASDLFKNWNVATGDQSKALDTMFQVSQATGVGVGQLSEEVTTNGVKLRALGMDLTDATMFIGGLHKAGVDVTSVMPAFSKELATAAKEGKNAGQVLNDTFNRIHNAKTDTEAAGIAMQVFGAKAGPQMAQQIREGKLSFDGLRESIGSDTINKAAQDTEHFGEKWTRFTNNLKTEVEPVATGVFDAVGGAVDKLAPIFTEVSAGIGGFIQAFKTGSADFADGDGGPFGSLARAGAKVREVFDQIAPKVQQFANEWLPRLREAFSTLVEKITPFWDALKGNQGLLITFGYLLGVTLLTGVIVITGALWSMAAAVIAATWPFVLGAAVIFALVVGIRYAYEHFETFRNVVNAVVTWLKVNVPPVFEAVRAAVMTAFQWIIGVAVPWIQGAFQSFMGFLQGTLLPAVQVVWASFVQAVQLAVNFVRPIIDFLVGFIQDNFGHIREIISIVWDVIKNVIANAWQVISNIIQLGLNIISGNWGAAWDNVKNIFSAVWDTIKNVVANGVGFIRETVQGIGAFIGSIGGRLFEGLSNGFKSAINWIIDRWNGLSFSTPNIPGTDFGGMTIGAPHIPRLHTGGVFHAASPGGEGLALLQDGERVLPRWMSDSNVGGGGAIHVHLHIEQGYVGDEEGLGRVFARTLVAAQRQGTKMPWES